MQGITFKLSGRYGHFKRPESNDNPSTYSYMHKVALVGFIGAVVGIERQDMKPVYQQLCDDLLYSIRILNKIIKEPHAFTKRYTIPSRFYKSGRRFCEYLKDPCYEITVVLKNERSKEIFDVFCKNIREGLSVYPTYFGSINCSAYVGYVGTPDVSDEKNGVFETSSVFSAQHVIKSDLENLDLIFEWIPTHSVDTFYTPEKIVQTVCSQSGTVRVSGPYRLVNETADCFF